ncbi:MAG: hypothetical protein WB475_09900, partial [Pseudolabrys sp.]
LKQEPKQERRIRTMSALAKVFRRYRMIPKSQRVIVEMPVFRLQVGADMAKAKQRRNPQICCEIGPKLSGCGTHIEQIVSVHDLFLA